jgi:hypothetical protein
MSRDHGQAKSDPRSLDTREAEILRMLLEVDFEGRDALAAQLQSATVTVVDDNGSLRFHIPYGARAEVVKRIPVEAEAADIDGMPVHILLHVVGGLLNELEVYREDSSTVQRPITPNSMRVLDA